MKLLNLKINYMIEQLKALEDYLITNKMQSTLASLRCELQDKLPQAPSTQFIAIFDESDKQKDKEKDKKFRKSVQLTQQTMGKKTKVQDKMRNEMIVEGLIGKIAYSSKLLDDTSINLKISNLKGNKIFEHSLKHMFPQTSFPSNIEHIESEVEFRDELDMIEANFDQQSSSQGQLHTNKNFISEIQMDQDESSIVSQPSLVLEELNRHDVGEEYTDDNDIGYYEFVFTEEQLLNGCSKLTSKFGYPEKAVVKNSKQEPKQMKILKQKEKEKGQNSKFPEGVSFPASKDIIYPRQYNGVIYDILKLKVIFDREKTGYEETSELHVSEGEVLAGRYRVENVLGSGVFAKVLKVYDLIKKENTCLKMVSNNKDFFDQALDEIKILRYINANCNPDDFNLLKFKGVFYHREHLFIETDLLKDNLFVAYRKNPAFFSIPILKEITRQILEALHMLHTLHIIHGDLKPENILIKSYHPIKIKVVDLGNSCFFHDHLGEYVQSRSYRAPEVILGTGYDSKIDIWSVGCIIGELWTKNVLYYNLHIQGMLARIQSIRGPWPEWMLDKGTAVENYFSKENLIFFQQENKFHILIPKATSLRARIRSDSETFINFLEQTLQIDPYLRPSAEQALEHAFIN